MKYHHACPKCASTDILRVPGRPGAYGSGNIIPVGALSWNAVRVTRYVCTGCGFVEEWVDDPLDAEKLRTKYGGQTPAL